MGFADITSTSQLPTSPSFQRTSTPFAPVKQSPLTPRRQLTSPSPLSVSPLSPPNSPPAPLKFAEIKRKHKPNPAILSKEDMRERRRNMFLRKLADAREQSRIQARGGEDEMMRMILVSEQRRWTASLAAAAAKIPTIEEETELELLYDDENIDDALVDEQDRELEAIFSQLDLTEHAQGPRQIGTGPEQVNICTGCGEPDSMVLVQHELVCFCCGWCPEPPS